MRYECTILINETNFIIDRRATHKNVMVQFQIELRLWIRMLNADSTDVLIENIHSFQLSYVRKGYVHSNLLCRMPEI